MIAPRSITTPTLWDTEAERRIRIRGAVFRKIGTAEAREYRKDAGPELQHRRAIRARFGPARRQDCGRGIPEHAGFGGAIAARGQR